MLPTKSSIEVLIHYHCAVQKNTLVRINIFVLPDGDAFKTSKLVPSNIYKIIYCKADIIMFVKYSWYHCGSNKE